MRMPNTLARGPSGRRGQGSSRGSVVGRAGWSVVVMLFVVHPPEVFNGEQVNATTEAPNAVHEALVVRGLLRVGSLPGGVEQQPGLLSYCLTKVVMPLRWLLPGTLPRFKSNKPRGGRNSLRLLQLYSRGFIFSAATFPRLPGTTETLSSTQEVFIVPQPSQDYQELLKL
ncbi:hypothetical protein O3P69_008457 [Scylla paramamosain]|uniref:Uncharacterized protein n=1 Tax=Scylla paramamosain TaxID=85552 RepID=A0AAW0SL26_SCYPA